MTALELLDVGTERVPEELAGEPWLQAELYRVLGVVNHALSRLDESRRLYELARADLDAVRADCPAIQSALEEADRTRRDELGP